MNNKKYYPFKRNNYYYGKLLTVRDFEDEQRYFNDKRRINNVLTTGMGIVSGLTVIPLNDRTVSVEAGMALDCIGREIIVDESVTKKLSVVEGFSELDDNRDVYLCIEYAEEDDEPAYSVIKGSRDGESEYNRFKEAYRLYLTNKALTTFSAGRRLAEETEVLHESGGVKITLTAPRLTNQNQRVEIKVRIEKTKFLKGLEVDFYIRAEHFKSPDGSDFIHVYYRDEESSEYRTAELSYYMTAGSVFDSDAEITVEKGIVSAGAMRTQIEPSSRKITITKKNIYDVLMKRYLSLHFDETLNMTNEIPIYLAKFRIIKKDEDYFIKDFEPVPFEQYIVSNETLYSYIRKLRLNDSESVRVQAVEMVNREKKETSFSMSSGSEQIEIEMKTKGKTYFSGEIAHGLGKGDVFVQAGFVDFGSTRAFMDTGKTLLGDASVLAGTLYEPEAPAYSSAVIVYPEKETFRIAVKFLANAERDEITVNWWAFKNNPSGEKDFAEIDRVMVTVNEKSVTLAPKEKFKFTASINGTDNKECKWSVVDRDGGEIDINGIYEAPGQEGVYEIMAQSVKYPHKRATTFVVVK